MNVTTFVKVAKHQLQTMRDNGWESLHNEVCLFYEKNKIVIPSMDNMFVTCGRPRSNAQIMTNLHHYQVELFYTIIDMQLQKLNNRFNEVNMELSFFKSL